MSLAAVVRHSAFRAYGACSYCIDNVGSLYCKFEIKTTLHHFGVFFSVLLCTYLTSL